MVDSSSVNWQAYVDEVKAKPPFKNGRRMPYVLFGFIGNQMINGSPVKTPTYAVLDMGGCHAQKDTVSYYHRKGHKILDFWFPKKVEANDGTFVTQTNFAELAEYCEYLKNSDPAQVKELQARNKELEAKADAMSRKIAEIEAKQGKRSA